MKAAAAIPLEARKRAAAIARGRGAARGGHWAGAAPAAAVVRRALAGEWLRRQNAAGGTVADLDPGEPPSLRAPAAASGAGIAR